MNEEVDKLFELLETHEIKIVIPVKEEIVENALVQLYNGEFVECNADIITLIDGRLAESGDDNIIWFDGNYYIEDDLGEYDIEWDFNSYEYNYSENLNYGFINQTDTGFFSNGYYEETTSTYYLDEEVLAVHGFEIINNEVVKIDESKISDNIKIIENCLQSVFPDRWEIINNTKSLSCYIYFPEITIVNSLDLTHKIHDLYVSFTIDKKTCRLLGDLKGFRTSFYKSELNAGYEHSHLSNNGGSFCLGSGPLSRIKADLVIEFNEFLFEAFLLSLDVYLKWESIETNPYKYIKSITSGREVTFNLGDKYFDKYDEFIKSLTSLPISINQNKVLEVDFDIIEEELTKFSTTFNRSYDYLYKDNISKKYYNIGSNNISYTRRFPISKFKNKELELKILDKEVNNLPIVIHFTYTNYVVNRINKEINTVYFNKLS